MNLPPIGNESTDGRVSGILRNADMLLLVIDLSEDSDIQSELLMNQLAEWNVLLLKKSGQGETKEYWICEILMGQKRNNAFTAYPNSSVNIAYSITDVNRGSRPGERRGSRN